MSEEGKKKKRTRRRRRSRSPKLFAPLALAILIAPLAIGGVHAPVVLALGTLVATSAALVMRRERLEQVSLSPLTIAFSLLAITACFQALPLPGFVQQIFHSRGFDLYAAAMGVWDGADATGWRTLSLDPGASLARGARWSTLALASLAIANMPLEKGVGRLIGVTILAAGALCALAGTGQFLLSDELFLGFYQAQIPPKMASTFVNWNHAASLYVLCAFIGGHIAVEYIGDKQTWWSRIGLCSAILFGALPWLSHGASAWVLLLATGCWSLVALAVRRKNVRLTGAATRILQVATLGALAASSVAVFIGARLSLTGELQTSVVTRAAVTRGALAASLDAPVLGVGAGAVERTIYPYIDWSVVLPYGIAVIENDLAEWLMTVGWFVGGCAIALLVFSVLAPISLLERDTLISRDLLAAFWMGVLAILIAQLHFPFIALGLGLPLVVWFEHMRTRLLRKEGKLPDADATWRKKIFYPQVPRKAGWGVLATLVVAMLGAGILGQLSYASPKDSAFANLSSQERQQLARKLPSESRLFVEETQDALDKDDIARAKRAAARAYALEPSAAIRAMYALVLARAGEIEEARGHIQALLDPEVYSRVDVPIVPMVLEAIRDPRQRAELFLKSEPRIWWKIALLAEKVEGEFGATSFLLEIVSLSSRDHRPYEKLLDYYARAKREEMISIWTEVMFGSTFEDPLAAREVAVIARVESMARQDQDDAALAFLLQAVETTPEAKRLQDKLILLFPITKQKPDERARPLLEKALDARCSSARDSLRKRCFIVRGYLAEYEGDDEKAEEIFQRLRARDGHALELARFYARTGRCLGLKVLSAQGDERVRKQINALKQKCRRPAP